MDTIDIPILNEKGHDNILTHKVEYHVIGENGPETQEDLKAIKRNENSMGSYWGYFDRHEIVINKKKINDFIYSTYFESFDLKPLLINHEATFLHLYQTIAIIDPEFEITFVKIKDQYVVALSIDLINKLIDYLKKKRNPQSGYLLEILEDRKKEIENLMSKENYQKFGIVTTWKIYGDAARAVHERFKGILARSREVICGVNLDNLKKSLEDSVKRHEEMHRMQNIRYNTNRASLFESRVEEKTSELNKSLKLYDTPEYYAFMFERTKVSVLMEVGAFIASIITKFTPYLETDRQVLIYEVLRCLELFKYDSRMNFSKTQIENISFNFKHEKHNYIEDNKHPLAMLMLVTGRVSFLDDLEACEQPWQSEQVIIEVMMEYINKMEKLLDDPYNFITGDFISNLLVTVDQKLEECLTKMDEAYGKFMELYDIRYKEREARFNYFYTKEA